MKTKTLFIAFLLISSVSYSQSTKDTSVKGQKNTNQETSANNQASKLVYEKIVHFTVKQDQITEFVEWVKENQKEFILPATQI